MTRRMSTGLQNYGIGRILAGTRWDNEKYDIKANIDRTLSYGENAANIRSQLGISTRNRGLETLHQQSDERKRETVRRKDTTRQSGTWQGEHNLMIDRMFQAMPPGKRFSAAGNRYYERRANRSDKGRLL